MSTSPTFHRGPQLAVAALVLGTLMALAPAVEAQAPGEPSSVRLAHLSPDTPEVDIYVTAPESEDEELVLANVAYAQASDYFPLDPGFYSFVMRPAGAAASEPGVLTLSAEVEAGQAYTFAALGRSSDLQNTILVDSLEPPAAGRTNVRFIQAAASLPTADVSAVDGPDVATGVRFTASTEYASVPAGAWTLQVSASGEEEPVAQSEAVLAAGTVVSLFLVDAPGGGVELSSLVDAGGTAVTPEGPIPTGGAGPRGAGWAWWLPVVAIGVALLAAPRRRLPA